jgi:hypothetical protein
MRLRLLFGLTTVALAAAFLTGLLRSGATLAALEQQAEREVAGCVHHAGVRRIGNDGASQRALNRCWSAASRDARFARLRISDPIAYERRLRTRRFAAWSCVERAGYRRTSGIPLSGPGGYPLQIAAGNFRLGPSDRALERFYRVAARCSGEPLATFRWSDGTFSREPADGTTKCLHHRHGGSAVHEHGCFVADPPSSGVAVHRVRGR